MHYGHKMKDLVVAIVADPMPDPRIVEILGKTPEVLFGESWVKAHGWERDAWQSDLGAREATARE